MDKQISKPSIDVKGAIQQIMEDRSFEYNYEVRKLEVLVEAVRGHVAKHIELSEPLKTAESMLQISKNGLVVPELIDQFRKEFYEECLTILNS